MACLVDLVFEMRDRLNEINENSYNNFMLRVGLNIGPVVAGVIGLSSRRNSFEMSYKCIFYWFRRSKASVRHLGLSYNNSLLFCWTNFCCFEGGYRQFGLKNG